MTSEQMKSYCVHVPDDGEEGGEGTSSKGYDKRVAHDKTYKSSIKMMKDNKGKTYHEKINEYPIYNSSAGMKAILIVYCLLLLLLLFFCRETNSCSIRAQLQFSSIR